MSKLVIEFPSDEHREAFSGWLSNSGEQEHAEMREYVEPEERHLFNLHFDYLKSHEGLIVATEFED